MISFIRIPKPDANDLVSMMDDGGMELVALLYHAAVGGIALTGWTIGPESVSFGVFQKADDTSSQRQWGEGERALIVMYANASGAVRSKAKQNGYIAQGGFYEVRLYYTPPIMGNIMTEIARAYQKSKWDVVNMNQMVEEMSL